MSRSVSKNSEGRSACKSALHSSPSTRSGGRAARSISRHRATAPDLDWGKLFKALWRYVLLLVGAWLALRYCSYHDSVMGMFFVACVVVIICTAMIIHRLNRLQKTMEEKK